MCFGLSGSAGSFKRIADKYRSIEDVQAALRAAGLESSNLIIGIDYTKSNEYTGQQSFGGRSLHALIPGLKNPYQRVIEVLGRTMEPFDDDNMIHVFGFGDIVTTNRSVFPFYPDHACEGFADVLRRYSEITPMIQLSGPTNFAPLIYQAIHIVKETKSFHILIIIADGQVVNEVETRAAIVEASKYPLSIVMVGVGDGPWELQREFDDKMPSRQFDNYQFVHFEEILLKSKGEPEASFAMHALMEVPQQFKVMRKLGLLNTTTTRY
jgi:E3 ubiquitin-protein ligase RGLG